MYSQRRFSCPVLFFVAVVIAQCYCLSLAGASDSRRYIVVFNKDAHPESVVEHVTKARLLLTSGKLIRGSAGKHRSFVEFRHAFRGFSAEMKDEEAQLIASWKHVASVEVDGIAQAMYTTKDPVNWGLDRIDQGVEDLDGQYVSNTTGCGVNLYVVDSGVKLDLLDFGGRARAFGDYVDDNQEKRAYDCFGHGTHVAGIIGSKTFGVAKRANIWSVRVLGCDGTGSNSNVIKALEDILENHQKPAIVNLAFATSLSTAVNKAVESLISAGVTVISAAGNDQSDACDYSPAASRKVISVGATDATDSRVSFSNFGSCVHVFAPGDSITSWWLSEPKSKTGTSAASAFVSGVAALYLEANPDASPHKVKYVIEQAAAKDQVANPGDTSPNLLLNLVRTTESDLANAPMSGKCSYACARSCESTKRCIWGECR